MTDIDIHITLRKCCRDALANIDKRRKSVKFVKGLLAAPSLLQIFGNKPVDQARKLIPSGSNAPHGAASFSVTELNGVVLKTCRALCEKHAEVHETAGEKLEAIFWREMAAGLEGDVMGTGSP